MQEAERLVSSGRKIDAIRVLREEQGLSLTEAKQRVDELLRPTGK
jgi:ribosomal protein L7/L12